MIQYLTCGRTWTQALSVLSVFASQPVCEWFGVDCCSCYCFFYSSTLVTAFVCLFQTISRVFAQKCSTSLCVYALSSAAQHRTKMASMCNIEPCSTYLKMRSITDWMLLFACVNSRGTHTCITHMRNIGSRWDYFLLLFHFIALIRLRKPVCFVWWVWAYELHEIEYKWVLW